MKKISAVGIGIILLMGAAAFAQDKTKIAEVIQPQPLAVTFTKTTNLIFPYAVKSVDKGIKNLLVQVAKGVENIIQIKAAVQGFPETNLTVITADGKLYSFLVNYTDREVPLNIRVGGKPGIVTADARFSLTGDNEATIQDYAQQVASKMPVLNKKDSKFDVEMLLDGIYIRDHMLYFQISLANNSNIAYDIDQLRFFIHDKKRSKRTASQETELQPEQVLGNAQMIRGRSKQTLVVALQKFTIPDHKFLTIQLMENNGGRNLELQIKNRLLVKARVL